MALETTKEEALSLVFSKWHPNIQTETVSIEKALNRVIAKQYYSAHNIPVFRSSCMDGIAVKSDRFKNGMPDASNWVKGVDYVRADTGDDFPDDYDAVIRIEKVRFLTNGGLEFTEDLDIKPGTGVNECGSSIETGSPLVEYGLPLRSSDIASLVMGGIQEVEVYRRPKVFFLPTGSELIPAGFPLSRGQNYDTNSIIAKDMLTEMGADVTCHSIVKDDQSKLADTLHTALSENDIVIISGGSSKGEEDFNTRLIEKEGELILHWAAAAPGRPIGIGIINSKLVVNIPGPPLAMFYCLTWCIQPIIYSFFKMPVPKKDTVRCKLLHDMKVFKDIAFISKMNVYRCNGEYYVSQVKRERADQPKMLSANAMFISPIGESEYLKGTILEIELLRNIAFIPERTAEELGIS
ncbi:MAG: molybdopterin molybdotransferase MoeA [Dehalococcoidales bacterium]|nr:molybdopterin molybdotransferase MoeA [Dehalococcoidales bacterium]